MFAFHLTFTMATDRRLKVEHALKELSQMNMVITPSEMAELGDILALG
ncbi:hypothetical protein Hdeb2414_s0139g00810211 [Helianthus debilis subsp. tardiflorus]